QVLNGMPMGEGWYLKAFPVWFARRGNYGVLLSQAKGLSAGAQMRGDSAAIDLAHQQAQWVVGRNPFVQSTMYGEGYDWSQQYSVSSGDFVGSLPVGMQSRGHTDLPYWSSQNMYVYKEVWVHPSARWLWLVQDLAQRVTTRTNRASLDYTMSSTRLANGDVSIKVTASGSGAHSFTLRAANLNPDESVKTVALRNGQSTVAEWKAKVVSANTPWVAVVVPDGKVDQRREIFGHR
ncbi:MAG TPA: hypothetical protein VM939_08280, partial [Gemmatimonadaceae bacterium]|nr:hypothetical protein [Gemmatimonadaceae bacterium]